ncbi:MAG: methylated-DNA--[protein]-cysteine S-methyltransferase [Acidobacteriota bacterium]|nr:methylated-DNA--[protein]-cysteine S-methyltransferase [Acidobacteriota bacterium]
MQPQQFFIDKTATPIGLMLIVSDEQGRLRAIDWEDHEARMHATLKRHYPDGYRTNPARDPAGFTSALNAYMEGDIDAIRNLAVETAGTPFQRKVWTALREIAPGKTETYGAMANRIGRPTASRAVGMANGANPVGVVVPCHRVIGANSSLTGYGGGLERKRWLLMHEASHVGHALACPSAMKY